MANEATLVGLGSLTAARPRGWRSSACSVTAVLMYRKVKGAILYGILITSLLAIVTRVPVYVGAGRRPGPFAGFPNGIVGLPVWPSDLVGQLDIGAALGPRVCSASSSPSSSSTSSTPPAP